MNIYIYIYIIYTHIYYIHINIVSPLALCVKSLSLEIDLHHENHMRHSTRASTIMASGQKSRPEKRPRGSELQDLVVHVTSTPSVTSGFASHIDVHVYTKICSILYRCMEAFSS